MVLARVWDDITVFMTSTDLTHSVLSVPITGKICFLTSYGLVILRVIRNYVNDDCRMALWQNGIRGTPNIMTSLKLSSENFKLPPLKIMSSCAVKISIS